MVSDSGLERLALTIYDLPREQEPRGDFEQQAYIALFLINILKLLQMDAPHLAGELSIDDAYRLRDEMQSVMFGSPFVAGSISMSSWHYGGNTETEGFRHGLRLVCLDPTSPITLELENDFGSREEESWTSLCVCLVGKSEEYCRQHVVTRSLLGFFGVSDEQFTEALDESRRVNEFGLDEFATPGACLMTYILDEPLRTRAQIQRAVAGFSKKMERAQEEQARESRRNNRQQKRQIESLTQQLETSRAIVERERAKAAAADKQLRGIIATQGAAGKPPVSISDSEGASNPSAGLEEKLLAAETTILQLSDELDESREQLYRLRLRTLAEPEASDDKGVAEVWNAADAPKSFRELEGWLAQWIPSERVFVHPKAIRTARKSTFEEPALIYRVLHAMAEHYWPMKMRGDEDAGRRWSAFLHDERLSCKPTGAAVSTHRTLDQYQVQFSGRRYPLDMHVQGSSSRKEQDVLRVYFHASKELGRILVGHFPGHLPNTLS